MNATTLSAIANRPDVRPWLGGDGALDLQPILNDARNLAWVVEDGGFIAVDQGEGRYEAHSVFRPDGEPQSAIHAVRDAVDYIFSASDAVELVTKAPLENLAAIGLARQAGFQRLCSALVAWSAAGQRLVEFYALSLDRWAMRSTRALIQGQAAHLEMAAALAARGSSLPQHSEDDETHTRMAGATRLMLQAGAVLKGLAFYNRYAAWSGYPPIQALSFRPVILDLGGLVVELSGERVEVLSCR